MKFTTSITSLGFLAALGTLALAAPSQEPRQTEEVVAVVELLVDLGMKLAEAAKEDDEKRGQFTQDMVSQTRDQKPGFNVVVVHPDHEAKFDGKEGKDWTQRHQEFDIQVGGTIGYDIYAGHAGEFTLKGDGGYLNWAFGGNVKTRDGDQGHHLVFGA